MNLTFPRYDRTKPDPLKLFSSWADKYGDIVSFKVGPVRFVLLNTYQAIVDAFQHPDLSNRPYSQMLKEVLGIVNHGKMVKLMPVKRNSMTPTNS